MELQKTEKQANKNRLTVMVQLSVLLAIEALFCFTPLGSIPAIGPIVATLMMLPILMTGMLLGVKAGTFMGFAGGMFSFLVWTFKPPSPVIAFIFTPFYAPIDDFVNKFAWASLLICFVPRILGGTFSAMVYRHMSKTFSDNNIISYITGATIGSLTNTFLVLGGIWAFFGERVSSIAGEAIMVYVGTTIIFSGVPEAVVAAVVCPSVCVPVKKIIKKF